jgi:hypothetical protein
VALTLLVLHRLDIRALLLLILDTAEVLRVLLAALAIITTVQIVLEVADIEILLTITQDQTLRVIRLQQEAQAQVIQTVRLHQAVAEVQAVVQAAAVHQEDRDNLSKLL